MKTVRKILAIAVAVMMMSFVFTACSTIEEEVLGDWTVSTINGMTRDQYAETVNMPSLRLALNLKLEPDKATISSVDGVQEYQVEYTSENAELLRDGNAAGTIAYNKDAQTLTIQNSSLSGGSVVEYVFVKGTTDLSEWGLPEDTSGLTGADYGERSEEDMMRDEMNNGYSGSDYGEMSEDELNSGEGNNAGFTGRDYGELDPDEMANGNGNLAITNTNTNRNNNTAAGNGGTGSNSGLTGRDYGERTEEELAQDGIYIDYGEGNNAGYTGRDYGERTEEDMMRDEMNNGYTGRDYGEGEG
ncbi:MAG: hypothetical protein IKE53_04415 [Clostridiales bacterium]|nr:hypothetical protein [Clostridiales bacterium]